MKSVSTTELSVWAEPSEQGEVAGFLAGAPVVGMIFGPTIGTLLYNLDPTFPFYYGGNYHIYQKQLY